MRRIAATDRNQATIVELLRQVGCLVQPTHQLGNGFPDLVIYYPAADALALVEVKAHYSNRASLTPDELAWHTRWQDAPLFIIASDLEALAMLEELKERYGG